MEIKAEFTERFKKEVLGTDGSMDTELLELFRQVLSECFNDDSALMDEFINNLSNEYSTDVELSPGEMQNRQAILELTDMFLGGL